MKMPKVSVVLLTKNRRELLRKCIYSLINQLYGNFEIIVLDEYSGDGTEAMVRQLSESNKNIIFIQRNKKGLGYGRNQGVLAAKGEIIAFIDDDEEAHADWLKNGIAAMERYQADIVRGAIYYPDGTLFRDLKTDNMQFPTANILYRKKVIESVGMFDERFDFGGEDVDLGMRAIQQGYRLILCKEAISIHCFYRGQKDSKYKLLWKVNRLRDVNRVLLFKKHETYRKKLILGIFYKKTHIVIITLFLSIFIFIFNYFTLNNVYINWLSIGSFIISYFMFRVFTDKNVLRFPQRILFSPFYIFMDFTETLYTIRGAIKYNFFIL